MLITQVQFAPWDKVYNFSAGNVEFTVGDYVIVKTELGMELGKVISLFKSDAKSGAAAASGAAAR